MLTDENITVNYDGETNTVSRKDAYAPKLIQALKDKDYDTIPELVSAAKRIEKFSEGTFQVRDGKILIDGVEAPTVLGNKIKQFADEGLPYEPLVKFAKKLQNNPSYRAVQELFQFLEKNNHPITDEGNFIAYKKVRPDFKDIYSRKFDNSVGNVVEMPRNQVDEDCNRTCSTGLHVAAMSYFPHYGGPDDTIIEVEVDPAAVVAVPTDYENSKMRVCSYKVLAVVDPNKCTFSSPLRNTSVPMSDDLEDEETYDEEEFYDEDDDDDDSDYYGNKF